MTDQGGFDIPGAAQTRALSMAERFTVYSFNEKDLDIAISSYNASQECLTFIPSLLFSWCFELFVFSSAELPREKSLMKAQPKQKLVRKVLLHEGSM